MPRATQKRPLMKQPEDSPGNWHGEILDGYSETFTLRSKTKQMARGLSIAGEFRSKGKKIERSST
jgi:hypothetical protein